MKIETTQEKVNEGINEIESNGGSVDRDEQVVRIQGVVAEYGFNKETGILIVNILDKPWLASESMIEGKIQEYFS